MTKRKELENKIWWLPLPPIKKLQLCREINILHNTLTGKREKNSNVSLAFSNSYYGHEYWIKKYSQWKKPIFGLIEHGVYFGNNMNMVGDERDYCLKNIITFGQYREEIINKAFPNHHVIKIGPRIAYANTDKQLYKQLCEESNEKKVITLFPAHSLVDCKYEYDIDYLLSKAKEVMKEYSIDYMRVCLKEQDMKNGTAEEFKNRGCYVVTAGSSEIDFLPRLRAIIESSYMTMSNSLGTNLGYCIYMKRPQILIRQNKSFTGHGQEYTKITDTNNPINIAYKKEEEMFINAFGYENDGHISNEQYQFCDYYWGFSEVQEPANLYKTLEALYLNQ